MKTTLYEALRRSFKEFLAVPFVIVAAFHARSDRVAKT